jgi:hypothetical protein
LPELVKKFLYHNSSSFRPSILLSPELRREGKMRVSGYTIKML